MQAAQSAKKIVCVGGGHCNCQVLKLFKQLIPSVGHPVKMTLVNEAPASYYSGMLPGSVSKIYGEKDIQIDMAPLASWCDADYVEKRVKKVHANENWLEMEDGSSLDYDVLALNVGSKTRDTQNVTGVWEHSLTTRPINELLPKIVQKEQELLAAGIVPSVGVCGAGAAGTELAFAFKARWSQVFNTPIQVTLFSNTGSVLQGTDQCIIDLTTQKLAEHGIDVVYDKRVATIDSHGVSMTDGSRFDCTVPVWATGASAQPVTGESDLATLNGYFQVNEFLQSTSHPNVFGGGDCVTMEKYSSENFPPKAGVYAVRQGPFIARNIAHYLKKEEMEPFVPQRTFLSLLMTGDEKAIGTKFGMAWSGRWVWKMKDYIDSGFMKLFMHQYLYQDYEKHGTKFPIENTQLFEEEDAETQQAIGALRQSVADLDDESAARKFICSEEEEEFTERLLLIQRMNADDAFADQVMKRYHAIRNRQ